jgi:adenylate kinase family enzyme
MAFIKGRAYPILKQAAEGNDEKAQKAKEILANVDSMSQDELDSALNEFFGSASGKTGVESATTGQKDVPDTKAPGKTEDQPAKPDITKTKKGVVKIGSIQAKKQMPDNRDGKNFIFGSVNETLGIKKITTEQDVEEQANKAGFNNDPDIKKASEEFDQDFNDPKRQTMIFNPQTGKVEYNLGTPELNKKREEEGQKWVADEIQKQQQVRSIKNEGQVYIVLGLPGSGKSTIADPMLKEFGAYEIDSDIFKDYTPEMKGGEQNRAAAVHEESGVYRDTMSKQIAEQRANQVIPTVGGSFAKLKKRIEKLKKLGYTDFHLVNVSVPLEQAMERNVKRFKSKKANKKPLRLVGKGAYIDDSLEKINNSFEEALYELKDDIRSWSLYDGKETGEKPTLVDSSENWQDKFGK